MRHSGDEMDEPFDDVNYSNIIHNDNLQLEMGRTISLGAKFRFPDSINI